MYYFLLGKLGSRKFNTSEYNKRLPNSVKNLGIIMLIKKLRGNKFYNPWFLQLSSLLAYYIKGIG